MNIRIRMHTKVVCSLVLAVVVGCGQNGPAKPPTGLTIRTQSQVVLSLPPAVSDYSGITAQPTWTLTGEGPSVEFVSADGARSTVSFTGQSKAMVVYPWTSAGSVTHYLVGTINAAEIWSLFRIHDVTGDGVPDESSKTLLFDTGATPAYITYIARAWGSSQIYLLDRRCQDILRAVDTNSDGFPDRLESAPFAQAAAFPELLDARMLVVDQDGRVDVPSGKFLVGYDNSMAVLDFPRPFDRFEDTDSDQVADIHTTWTRVPGAPWVYGRPYDGQTLLKIAGQAGSVAQIWTVDDNDQAVAQLGTVTLGTGEWTSVTISTALQEDGKIRLNYGTNPSGGAIVRVWKDWPQLYRLSDRVLDRGGDSVTLEGVNLHASVVVRLRTGPDLSNIITLPVTVHSTESATVTIPALPASAVGTATLELYDPAHPILDGLTGAAVSVCEPGGG